LRGKECGKLLRKLVLQTLTLVAVSVGMVVSLRILLYGKLADGLIWGIGKLLGVSWDSAWGIYQSYIRNNMDWIIRITVVVCFLILFRLTMGWFTQYFDQIVMGVDRLKEESDEKISMSPELGFIEDKLNEVRGRLKQRAEEARAAEQRKNDLVVYLAHDIRTPLTSVIGYLSLLDEARDMPEEQRAKYVHIAFEKACRLETLVGELFEITRYNLQSVPLRWEPVDLCTMMVQISDELYPELAAGGKEIRMDVGEELCLYGDGEKLARVFNNILRNAIAYGRSDGPIFVRAEQWRDQIILSIENEGTIPDHQLEAIFEKFYRVDTARPSSTGGAGLGLAIARDIVTSHGGTIDARCEKGKTIFTVRLPAAPTP